MKEESKTDNGVDCLQLPASEVPQAEWSGWSAPGASAAFEQCGDDDGSGGGDDGAGRSLVVGAGSGAGAGPAGGSAGSAIVPVGPPAPSAPGHDRQTSGRSGKRSSAGAAKTPKLVILNPDVRTGLCRARGGDYSLSVYDGEEYVGDILVRDLLLQGSEAEAFALVDAAVRECGHRALERVCRGPLVFRLFLGRDWASRAPAPGSVPIVWPLRPPERAMLGMEIPSQWLTVARPTGGSLKRQRPHPAGSEEESEALASSLLSVSEQLFAADWLVDLRSSKEVTQDAADGCVSEDELEECAPLPVVPALVPSPAVDSPTFASAEPMVGEANQENELPVPSARVRGDDGDDGDDDDNGDGTDGVERGRRQGKDLGASDGVPRAPSPASGSGSGSGCGVVGDAAAPPGESSRTMGAVKPVGRKRGAGGNGGASAPAAGALAPGWPHCPFGWNHLNKDQLKFLLRQLFPGGGGGVNAVSALRSNILAIVYGTPPDPNAFRELQGSGRGKQLGFLRTLYERGALVDSDVPEWARTAVDAIATFEQPHLSRPSQALTREVLRRLGGPRPALAGDSIVALSCGMRADAVDYGGGGGSGTPAFVPASDSSIAAPGANAVTDGVSLLGGSSIHNPLSTPLIPAA